ncbi:MAG: MFS transporter [Bacteroidales bacterium]|nr:MFS transporter [Bacteroidales bacterium]
MISKNIPLLYFIKFCKWYMLYVPVYKLFIEESGFNDEQLFWLRGIYSLVIALAEIPSGYMADKWGRKHTLQLGTLLGVAGFAVYYYTHSFWLFMIAEIALGLGQSFISGSDSALLYETLKQRNKESKYTKVEGGVTATGNIAEALAGVSVSILAFGAFRQYYFLQIIIALLAFIFSIFLKEPSHLRNLSHNQLLKTIKNSLIENAVLRRIIILSALFGIASLSCAWFIQIVLFELQFPEEYYGYVSAVNNVVVAVGSFISGYVAVKIHRNKLTLLLLLVLGGCLLAPGIWLSYYSFIFITVFLIFRGVVHPVMKQYMNDECSSDIRATILSIRSLIIRLLFFLSAPLIGFLSSEYSIQYAFLYIGILLLVPGLIIYRMMIKNK